MILQETESQGPGPEAESWRAPEVPSASESSPEINWLTVSEFRHSNTSEVYDTYFRNPGNLISANAQREGNAVAPEEGLLYFRPIGMPPTHFSLENGADTENITRVFKMHMLGGLEAEKVIPSTVARRAQVGDDLRVMMGAFRGLLESSKREDWEKVPEMIVASAPGKAQSELLEKLGFSKIGKAQSPRNEFDFSPYNVYGLPVDSANVEREINLLNQQDREFAARVNTEDELVTPGH